MSSRSSRSLAISLVVTAAVAGVVVGASQAAATTVTSCSAGYSPWTQTSVNFYVPGSSCPSFADNGATYVFDIGTLNVAQRPPLDPSKPAFTQLANVVATCTGYTRTSTVLTATNCTITH